MSASVFFHFDTASMVEHLEIWSGETYSQIEAKCCVYAALIVSGLLQLYQGYFSSRVLFWRKGNSPINAVISPFSQLYRTFTSITPLRPTLSPSAFKPTSSVVASSEVVPLDLLPKISTHPALSTTQVRCGPRNTFSPSHFVRKRRHGFLSRIKTRKGRATLQRRKSKRRSTLSH